jgi:hypothetical protein
MFFLFQQQYIFIQNAWKKCYVMKYLCHKWSMICSDCRSHNPVLSSIITYHHHVCNKSNTTGATSGAGTAILPEHMSSSSVYGKVRVTWSLASSVVFCLSLFVLFLLVIVLSVLLWFTTLDYPFVICKHFLR